MEDMLTLAAQDGIIVEYYPFQKPLLGIYMQLDGTSPIIGLSTHLKTLAEKRCVMAEELGHHFTSVGNCIPDREFYHYSARVVIRSEEHTSELQSLMRISYAVFCLKKKKIT